MFIWWKNMSIWQSNQSIWCHKVYIIEKLLISDLALAKKKEKINWIEFVMDLIKFQLEQLVHVFRHWRGLWFLGESMNLIKLINNISVRNIRDILSWMYRVTDYKVYNINSMMFN